MSLADLEKRIQVIEHTEAIKKFHQNYINLMDYIRYFDSVPAQSWVQGINDCEYRKVNGKWYISKLKFTRTLASDPSLYP